MFVNLFPGGEALVEPSPQGDARIPLRLPEATASLIARLIQDDDEAAAAIAAVFLAGVWTGERAVAVGRRRRPLR